MYCPMKSRGCEWMGPLEQLENHRRVCSHLPVQYSNRCGVMYERENFEDHMKIFDKEELECCFSHTGCKGRFLREDEERRMEENTKKHLSLMATTMLKISIEMEKKEVIFQESLNIKHREQEVKLQELFQEKLQEQDEKLQEQQDKLQKQEIKLQGKEDELEQIREELEKKDRKMK